MFGWCRKMDRRSREGRRDDIANQDLNCEFGNVMKGWLRMGWKMRAAFSVVVASICGQLLAPGFTSAAASGARVLI